MNKTKTKSAKKPKQAKQSRKRQKNPKKQPVTPTEHVSGNERINRYLAHCGLCSRREADRWIEAGRIAINGETITRPGTQITAEDQVSVDGKPVTRQTSFTYILYNKPAGQLCSRRDDKGRALIYENLEVAPNVQSIGRLDMNTEGLLLLTDDGALARAMMHPSARLAREYRVRVAGLVALETLEKIRTGGLDIGDGERSEPWEVIVDAETRGHTWLTIVIRRGRNREVRRTLEAVGHPVRRLMRTRFGPIKLDEAMPRGSSRKLTRNEIRRLREQFLTD